MESLTYDAQKVWRPAVHSSLTWISHRGRTAERPRLCLAEHRDSKRRIHHLRKNIAVEEALAPSGVQVRKRFARRYFAGRFAGGLQFLHAIAAHNQHVAIVPTENLVWPITAPAGPRVTCYTASLHLVDFKCA